MSGSYVELDRDYVPIESYDWQQISESDEYSCIRVNIMFLYGMLDSLRIISEYGESPTPCMLVKKKEASAFISKLKKTYPNAVFCISDKTPSAVVHLLYKYYAYLNKREKTRVSNNSRVVDIVDRDINTPILDLM